MIAPIYQVSAEAIRLISEISEQIGILKALMPKTSKTESTHQELPFDPFLEDDLSRAQKKMVDELSTNGGYYRTDDQRVKLHMAMLFDWLLFRRKRAPGTLLADAFIAPLATDFSRPVHRAGSYRPSCRILSCNGLFR